MPMEVLAQEESLSEPKCIGTDTSAPANFQRRRVQGQTILCCCVEGVSPESPKDWACCFAKATYFPEVKAIHCSQSLNGRACRCCSPFGCCCSHSYWSLHLQVLFGSLYIEHSSHGPERTPELHDNIKLLCLFSFVLP